jgi:hypothetical protein
MRSKRDLAGISGGLRGALTADPAPDELTGEAEALAAYRAVSWDRRWSWRRPALLATKLGAATVACVLGLSGVATAAYTGSLPDSLQDVAHKAIKAPKAHKDKHGVGPDAKGPAAYGLCQAFAKDKQDQKDQQDKDDADKRESPKAVPPGQAKKQVNANANGKANGNGQAGKEHGKQGSVAYRNLVQAAGGEDKVEAYCATVPKPTDDAEPKDSEKPRPSHPATGKPTAKPTQATP